MVCDGGIDGWFGVGLVGAWCGGIGSVEGGGLMGGMWYGGS